MALDGAEVGAVLWECARSLVARLVRLEKGSRREKGREKDSGLIATVFLPRPVG